MIIIVVAGKISTETREGVIGVNQGSRQARNFFASHFIDHKNMRGQVGAI